MKKSVCGLYRAMGALLVSALALALCLGWSASARAASEGYYLMVSVTDLSPSGKDSCNNSYGYIKIPTVKADGSEGEYWYATARAGDWDHEKTTLWYTGQCSGSQGTVMPDSVDYKSWVDGFPTELLLVNSLDPNDTHYHYMTNDNHTYSSEITFAIWISADGENFTKLCEWDEVTSAGGHWSDEKTVPGSKKPKATSPDAIVGPDTVTIPRSDAGDAEYQFSCSAVDQYGALWQGTSPTFVYLLGSAPDGISLDSTGKLTISPDVASLDTCNGPFQITIVARLLSITSGTALKQVTVSYPQYNMRYHSSYGSVISNTLAEFGTTWTHNGVTTDKPGDKNGHYTSTGWSPDPTDGIVVTGDIDFQPQFSVEPHMPSYSNAYTETTCTVCGYHDTCTPSVFLAGGGTLTSPWRIGTTADWNNLVAYCEAGGSTSGYYALTSDINVYSPIGTEGHPFRGRFDGGGHTMNCSITSLGTTYTGLFAYAEGGEYSNLRVTGHITGRNYVGGLIGCATDVYPINDCVVEVLIDGVNAPIIGGFVCHAETHINLSRCVFAGSFGSRITYGGIIYGTLPNNSVNVYIHDFLDLSDSSLPMRGSNSGSNTQLSNIYFVRSKTSTVVGRMAHRLLFADDAVEAEYLLTQSHRAYNCWGVGACDHGIIYGGVYYGAEGDTQVLTLSPSLTGSGLTYTADSGTLTCFAGSGAHTLTMPGGDMTIRAVPDLPGSGTAADPWQVADADGWNALASFVDFGFDTAGTAFVQTAGFSPAVMVGSEERPFMGVYDGGGQTLTVDFSGDDHEDRYIAPFRWIKNATVRNLVTAGTVARGRHSSGLVGAAGGACLIENCRVGVSLTDAGKYAGGILGHGHSSETTIRGCVFTGSIAGSQLQHAGTVWGWSEGTATATVEDCLDLSESAYPMVLSYRALAPDSRAANCYYTAEGKNGSADFAAIPGSKARSVTAGEGAVLSFGQFTAYSVSGLSGYPAGLAYSGAFYAGEGDILSLNLALADGIEMPEDCVFGGFVSSAGILKRSGQGWSLTMPDASVMIDALFAPVFGETDFALPGSLEAIEAEAFENAAMTALVIPASCSSIGDHAFRCCQYLSQVRIPAGCVLGEDVFDMCELVYVYGVPGSPAEDYCAVHGNCVFVEE